MSDPRTVFVERLQPGESALRCPAINMTVTIMHDPHDPPKDLLRRAYREALARVNLLRKTLEQGEPTL